MISVSIFSPVTSRKSFTVHFVRQKLGHRVKRLTQDHSCMHAKSLQLCPTLCNLKDCGPPGSSIHGVLQATVLLECAAISFSRGSSWPRHRTCLSLLPPALAGKFFTTHSPVYPPDWLALALGATRAPPQGLGSQLPVYVLKGSIENICTMFPNPHSFFLFFYSFREEKWNQML